MSLILGAEQGPKADPTTTTYVPRPEWYFFFLFELLRVIKPPELVPIATIGIPTLCMVLLLLLPFYDRNPERRPERRPVATTAGDPDDHRDGLPDLPRRLGRLADRDRAGGPAAVRGRQAGRRPVGLPRLPQVRRERQRRPGPGADRDRRQAARAGDRADPDQPLRDHARSTREPAARRSSTAWSSSSPRCSEPAEPRRRWPPRARPRARTPSAVRGPGPGDVRPDRGRLRPDEHGDDRRPAPPLARARRRPGRARPRRLALDVCCGTGDLALELAGRVGPGGRVVGSRLLRARCSTWRARRRPSAGAEPVALRVGRRARAPLRRRVASTRSPSASGSATSPTSTAASRELARVLKPGGPAGDPRDHPARSGRRSRPSSRSGSTGSCRCSARSPATATPTPTCPSR